MVCTLEKKESLLAKPHRDFLDDRECAVSSSPYSTHKRQPWLELEPGRANTFRPPSPRGCELAALSMRVRDRQGRLNSRFQTRDSSIGAKSVGEPQVISGMLDQYDCGVAGIMPVSGPRLRELGPRPNRFAGDRIRRNRRNWLPFSPVRKAAEATRPLLRTDGHEPGTHQNRRRSKSPGEARPNDHTRFDVG